MSTAPSAMRSGALLRTKLFPPAWQPRFIPRPGLRERLAQGSGAKLTLVSAPPGFGKSTLLAEWLATEQRPVAWVSLDDGDNVPGAFWSLLLRAFAETLGDDSLASSAAPGVQELLEKVAGLDPASDLVLVLDDLHVITDPALHEDIALLVDHLPSNLHLVLASRADPPLPLARLRARGELEEIRAADLRFAGDDIARFFKSSAGLELDGTVLAALERETEGWIAALKLAALSMRGRTDLDRFIAEFSGEDRYIVDYLVEEVLDRQSPETRAFLLKTAILDRLSAPLCDAVTGADNARATLATLERNNLFLIPLDDRRRWYRYHHLFADVLRAHLLEEMPSEVPGLHRRASAWFEANGEQAEAIRHAFAAADFPLAARLIEAAIPYVRSTRQEALMVSWMARLPEDAMLPRPVLAVGYAGILLSTNQPELAVQRLKDAEAAMARLEDGSLQVPAGTDPVELASAPAWIALYHSALAQAAGDPVRTQQFSQQAIAIAAPGDHVLHGAATALLGLSRWAEGDLEGAYDAFAAGMERLGRAGFVTDTVGGSIALADIRISQGRLDEAAAIFRQGLRIAEDNGTPHLRGTADMHVGLAEIACERNDIATAADSLALARNLGDAAGFPRFKYRWRVAMARLCRARGERDQADEMYEDAGRFYVADFHPDTQPVHAERARLWLAQGRVADAARWARESGTTLDAPISVTSEFEMLTLARLHLANAGSAVDIDPAVLDKVQRIREEARLNGRVVSAIDALLIEALLLTKAGLPGAAEAIEQACTLAEPQRFVRPFIEEGEPLREILLESVRSGTAGRHARELTTRFEGSRGEAGASPPQRQAQPLPEPLTPRELEILRLIASGMQNQEIADHFVLSVATVKRHIANIYGKLDVGHRTAAIVRANELRLI